MRVPVALTGKRLDGYLAALTRAGASVIVPAITDDPGAVLDEVGALVLGGGPDVDPARYGQDHHPETYGADEAADRFDIALLEGALARGLPVLAICRGLQVLNVAFGGSLHQHIPDDPGVEPHGRPGPGSHALAHSVAVEPGSLIGVVPALLLMRFLFGAVTAPLYPSTGRLNADWVPAEHRTRVQGLINAGAGFGGAISPLIFTWLMREMGWRKSFVLAGGLTALLALGWHEIGRAHV